MVVPAQGHAVVGVRRAAAGVLGHVMDLAPARCDVAAGNQALAIASHDRTPLMHGEDPIRDADADDPALVEQHPLDSSGARRVQRDRC